MVSPWAYLGLVPRRYQSGEVDYTGSISKCGDRRMRTLLYQAANVMLTRYKGPKLKDWKLALARRSTMRKARIALARRLAISCMQCCGTAQSSKPHSRCSPRQENETSSRAERRPREGMDDGADSVACGQPDRPTALSTKPLHTQLTPSSAT